MERLTLATLSENAFRILGLTAAASQADVDAAARRLRIFQDEAMIPASENDAPWIGPIRRSGKDIENAVARLADPLSRLQERFWWFCDTPPVSDSTPSNDRSSLTVYHDAAIVYLYRSLLGNPSKENLRVWESVVDRFKRLSKSDDYLQWLMEVESNGDFEKAATLDEMADAQQNIPLRLTTALGESVQDAMEAGDFASARKMVQLVGADASSAAGSDDLLDRMEDQLSIRCRELSGKIDDAWKTRKIALMRPACNQAVSRYESVILPLIGNLVSSTRDIDRQNRARNLGVELLTHTAKAYGAFENYKASERALALAAQLAHGTPIAPLVTNLVEKNRLDLQRQKKDSRFKLKPGGGVESVMGASPLRWLWWVAIVASSIARAGCSFNSSSSPSNGTPYHIPSNR